MTDAVKGAADGEACASSEICGPLDVFVGAGGTAIASEGSWLGGGDA